jgi:hypothetical protein
MSGVSGQNAQKSVELVALVPGVELAAQLFVRQCFAFNFFKLQV